MQYEETPIKKSKVSKKTLALKELDTLNTSSILWFVIKRHKFGLVSTWAILVTLFYLVPFLPDALLGLL